MESIYAQPVSDAERILGEAVHFQAAEQVTRFFGRAAPTALLKGAPPADDLNTLLSNAGAAPGTTSVVTVPSNLAPQDPNVALIQNVQMLDSLISTLTACAMYNAHPAPYDLSNKQQAAQFVTDVANYRNFVVTGGTVKSVPMYLPLGEASTQTIKKSTTSADLHLDLLTAMFGALGLPAAVMTELDGILTEVADSLKSLQLSFETQTQTLNHFVSFYHLTPVDGTNPPINQMNVDLIYLQMDQSSWKASAGKSSVSHFSLDVSLTRTSGVMSSGIVSANAGTIIQQLTALTGNDASTIAKMTNVKGVKT